MKIIHPAIILILSFLSLTTTVLSQSTKIDSLKKVLGNHVVNDTTKVDLLYKIAFANFQRDVEQTKFYLGEAEDLSDSLNYIKGKAKVSYLKGILESRKSNYAGSLTFFENSLKYYESIQDESGIAAVYSAFGITHFVQSEFEEALGNYKKAIEILERLGDKKELTNSLIWVANVYAETGRYEKAISNYKKALQQYELMNDKEGISYVQSNLGVLYKFQGNYPLAIKYYNERLNYSKITGDSLGIAVLLNNLGDIYTLMSKYDTALAYHKQSLNLSIQKENKEQIAINNGNIGNIYTNKKEYLKALDYYHKSLEISQEINDVKNVSISFNNIGETNLLLNKPQIARENFIKAKEISQETGHRQLLSSSFLGISASYLQEKQYAKALSFAKESKDIAVELELLETQKRAAELLSIIYDKTGQYKKALENHQQYKTLNDSLFNKENIEKITQIEYEYKYKQALDSASIRELQLTKAVIDTNKDLEKSQKNYLLAVIGVLLVSIVLGSIIFYLKYRNIKSITRNIITEQKLLRSQMTPHFIFNSLSVLQGMILNKEEKKSISYLSKFSKLLRITLENSRDKMVLLSEELEAVENYLALQNLENEVYQYTVSLEETIEVPLFEIPPMLIQPFVENAIEHAFVNEKEDRKIDIHLSYIAKKLICTITDNGIGINTEKEVKNHHKKSLSTTITSERLKILANDFKMEGSVTIEDRQPYNQQGTKVTLVIPHKINAA